MENLQDELITEENDVKELKISEISREHIKETSKWAVFLSIVGFVYIAIMVLLGLSFGYIFNNISKLSNEISSPMSYGTSFGAIYIVFAIIMLFPCLYLYKYGKKSKFALETNDNDSLEIAFSNMKSLFKFTGIYTIIMLALLALYIIVLIIGLSVGMSF